MKLTSELLLYQLLTQFLPGFDHERETFGSPLLDARLHPMRSDGMHDHGPERDPGSWRAEPPQPLQKAAPLHAEGVDRAA